MPRVALLFGHTSKLGASLVLRLLDDGYTVLGVARSRLPDSSPGLVQIEADLLDRAEVNRVLGIIDRDFSGFDVMIYAVGGLASHDLGSIDYDDLKYVFELNTFVPMIIESHLLERISANGAHVVNITSSSIVDYYPSFAGYASSKIALQKFNQDLQRHLKNSSARVTEICPSGFASDLYPRMHGTVVARNESIQIPAEAIADLIFYILKTPRVMEVTQIFVNRK